MMKQGSNTMIKITSYHFDLHYGLYDDLLYIDRAINGFLNTGKGGTIYLGINDEGVVKGIRLSQYQVFASLLRRAF